MDLAAAQAQLDQAQSLVTDLEGKVAADAANEGLKASLAAAKDKVTNAQVLVDALSRAETAEATTQEQAKTIERLTTTRSTTAKRQADVGAAGTDPFADEIKEIQELAASDPGAAATKLTALWPKMRTHMSDAAINQALHATKIYIDNRQAIDSVEQDPKLAHLRPFTASIRSRVIVLNNEGKSLKEAMDTALKEAQALYEAGKKAAEPATPAKPAPGAKGAAGGGGAPPAPAHEPTLPAPSEELAAAGAQRKARATGAKAPA